MVEILIKLSGSEMLQLAEFKVTSVSVVKLHFSAAVWFIRPPNFVSSDTPLSHPDCECKGSEDCCFMSLSFPLVWLCHQDCTIVSVQNKFYLLYVSLLFWKQNISWTISDLIFSSKLDNGKPCTDFMSKRFVCEIVYAWSLSAAAFKRRAAVV